MMIKSNSIEMKKAIKTLKPSPPVVTVNHITHQSALETFNRVISFFSEQLSKNVDVISIKVNLCDYRLAESGATTDPELLEALVISLRNRFKEAKINIIENDATSVEANSLFSLLGFNAVAERCNINLVNVANSDWIIKKVPNGMYFKELEIPRVLQESDILINFAKLKTNALTKTTGALKNMFGLIRTKRKSLFHAKIDEAIADINQVISPDLCIVDGYIGMEGLGPAFGKPKKCALLIAGVDPVAVDSCCARIMGFYPRFVRHIVLCERCAIGRIKYRLHTDIDNFSYSDYKFEFPGLEYMLRSMLRRHFHIGAAG